MTATPEASALLRSTVLPALRRRSPYASMPTIRRALAGAGSRVQPAMVNRCLKPDDLFGESINLNCQEMLG